MAGAFSFHVVARLAQMGVEVGAPRRPGHAVGPADREAIERLVADIARAEEQIAEELDA